MTDDPRPTIRLLTLGCDEARANQLSSIAPWIEPRQVEGSFKMPEPSEHVAALLIDERFGRAEAAKISRRLRDENRSLPLIWMQEQDQRLTAFGPALPDLIWTGELDRATFVAHIEGLLFMERYPSEVMTSLHTATLRRLEHSFHAIGKIQGTYLESCNDSHQVNAFVPLCGKNISGRISVCGPAASFAQVLSVLIGNQDDHPIRESQDLAAEIANQISGQFKRSMARHDIQFEVGTVARWSGPETRIRFGSSPCQLVFDVDCGPVQPLCVGLALDRLFSEDIRDVPGHTLEDGDFAFL